MHNSRARAATVLCKVLIDKINLDEALNDAFVNNAQDRAFIQELCYGTLRFYPRLTFFANQLLQKPLGKQDTDLHVLILVGLYQLLYLETPPHAAISETVEATKQLKKAWASKLVNAILRNFQRQRDTLVAQAETEDVAQFAHPTWILQALKTAYPQQWQIICAANNVKPPFTLRVNVQKINREDYLQKLNSLNPPLRIPPCPPFSKGGESFVKGGNPLNPPFEKGGTEPVPAKAGRGFSIQATAAPLSECGIYLSNAIPVPELPGFMDGEVSVQDEAAQLAASLLDLKPQQRVLDACAAPGGKTCHLLETEPTLQLTAVELSPLRAKKIHENLARLQLNANVIPADAGEPESWWDKILFDRILLDAPCSATGVIRRHPDIKLLRRASDIAKFAAQQWQLLTALWPLLKPNGLLLYATCSVLPIENSELIQKFLQAQTDAALQTILHPGKTSTTPDWQLLPEINGHDGFYYALLKKVATRE